MSTEQATCCGCYLKKDFVGIPDIDWVERSSRPCPDNSMFDGCGRYDDPHYESYGYYLPDKNSLTTEELKILQHTKDIWEEFLALPDKVFYDNQEMQEAIHRVQNLIALRVARRVDTMIWRQPDAN